MPSADRSQLQRVAAAAAAPTPDCAVAKACPELDIDLKRCIDDPELFEITAVNGSVVDVEVADDTRHTLPPGTWSTVVGDRTACDEAVAFTFEVLPDEEVAP